MEIGALMAPIFFGLSVIVNLYYEQDMDNRLVHSTGIM